MARVIPQGDSQLPPPGDERREVLAERTDNLAEAAERLGAERASINPKAFHVDNEIADHIDDLSVTNRRPEYEYCWVFTGQQGRMIRMKTAQGWEVVQGDEPEAMQFKGIGADTTRRHGDVILMKCRKDRFKLLQKQDEKRRQALLGSPTAGLEDLGDRYNKAGVVVHSNMDSINPRIANRMMARQMGERALDNMIRDGDVPGMPAPGRER